MKRYSHGVVAIHADPDFEESPDGDVYLVEEVDAEIARLNEALAAARDIARKVPGLEFDLKAKTYECELADAEVTRLTEAPAAAERFGKDAAERHARDSSAYEARVRELEARLADTDMGAALERVEHAESECAALRAEVERLRDGNNFLSRELGRAQADADSERCERVQLEETDNDQLVAAEVRLAAANALTRWEPCQAESEEDDDGPLFQGFLTDPNGTWVRWEDLARVLAAQPVTAPARTECVSGYVGAKGECNDCGEHHADAPARSEQDVFPGMPPAGWTT